jgi:hypothetical protein
LLLAGGCQEIASRPPHRDAQASSGVGAITM